jgi:hypothetical protein
MKPPDTPIPSLPFLAPAIVPRNLDGSAQETAEFLMHSRERSGPPRLHGSRKRRFVTSLVQRTDKEREGIAYRDFLLLYHPGPSLGSIEFEEWGRGGGGKRSPFSYSLFSKPGRGGCELFVLRRPLLKMRRRGVDSSSRRPLAVSGALTRGSGAPSRGSPALVFFNRS